MTEPNPIRPAVPGGSMRRVAIVGASLGGLATAAALRDKGFDGEVVVVEAEAQLPNDRPPLSKQVITGEWPLERARQPEASSVDDLALDLRLGRRAIHLDVPTRTLTLDDATTVAADAVVLACGSAAKRPPIPVIDRPGFTPCETAPTLRPCAGLAASPTRVLIVGAGFIGLEVASSARELELAVTVVEAFATPAGRILPGRGGRRSGQGGDRRRGRPPLRGGRGGVARHRVRARR
ncbi:MAG: FAD-dependent oxidoreductase [Microthrixaceae bacterium]